MLTVLAILGVLCALFLAAVLATREDQALVPAPQDRADLGLPPGRVGAQDVRGLRFSVAVRGYRMSEVDAALERLAAALAERDRRIEELEGTADPAGAPALVPPGASLPDSGRELPAVGLTPETSRS